MQIVQIQQNFKNTHVTVPQILTNAAFCAIIKLPKIQKGGIRMTTKTMLPIRIKRPIDRAIPLLFRYFGVQRTR